MARVAALASALIGVILVQHRVGADALTAGLIAVAATLGLGLGPAIFSALHERLRRADLPVVLRGAPIGSMLALALSAIGAGTLLVGTPSTPLDIAILTALFLACGSTQQWAVRVSPPSLDTEPLADRIDRLLPQTQCGQCSYAGCRPYAEAIARNEADINQCPPGGEAGIRALAALLGREPKSLNPDNGIEKPKAIALIDEATCIGCTKCIQACPVDAILGASKLMHTVVADLCTGCELCLPPCPVDCIEMLVAESKPTRVEASR